MKSRLFLLLMLSLLCLPVTAAIDAYPFPDEQMQQRYDALIDELRCPQCLNTNLAGSDAMIAQDLRREVHRMLMDGKSDQEILDFMHERYGDFILYRPKFGVRTALLWLGPALFLLLAFAVLLRMMTRKTEISRISDEDQARLDHLLGDTDKS